MMNSRWTGCGALLLALLVGCASDSESEKSLPSEVAKAPAGVAPNSNVAADGRIPEALSLSGEPLYSPAKPAAEQAELEAQVLAARKAAVANPSDANAWIWYGRMQAAAGHFREALETFEVGVKKFPDDAKMYRHLGHRYITVRKFAESLRALEKSARLAENMPDESEAPTKVGGAQIDTFKQNVYYHLGLVHFLLGHFERAAEAFTKCGELAANVDSMCSAAHWTWVSLMRAQKIHQAKALVATLPSPLEVVEYVAYRDLCLLYRGELDGDAHFAALDKAGVDYATFGNGLGQWHLANGRTERAREVFTALAKADAWMAFGRICAEVELTRLSK